MNFKKRVNGSWRDTPHYIHNTSTDTITTLPAVLYPNGTTATVGLKGQTVQSGTPSPDNPVMSQGTGERTGNLWNEDYTGISGSIKYAPVYVGNGSFILSTSCPIIEGAASLFFLAGNVQSGASTSSNGVYKNRPITVASSDGYVTVAYRYVSYQSGIADPRNEKTMLNSGSTALPYEPYGFEISISSASTTTPTYLGEVPTTRRVKKLVLTGNEPTWTEYSSHIYRITINGYLRIVGVTLGICSHYNSVVSAGTITADTVSNNSFTFLVSSSGNNYVYFRDDTINSVNALKAYMSEQYAAGTPVTVWYVLATEETATVNEPLMRIGDYADTLSNVSIPVTAGGDTLSVGTTVQPSEVTVNYKGWHPVQNVHEFIGNYTIGTMQTLPISELETHTISELQGGEWS